MANRALRLAAVVALSALAASGCGFRGLYGVSLPGGAPHGPSYQVTAIFDNVQDLVPQSAVKVNDVTVGSVDTITLTPDLRAKVVMRVEKKVSLPANTVAILEQTSLLGEKFVQLGPPLGAQPQGHLQPGAVIQHGNTSAYPDVEEVFGVLSNVLNGGSLQDMQTISVELAKAMSGREQRIQDFLRQLDHFVSGMDQQKQQIVRAIDALDRLSARLVAQKQDIAKALDDLGPGLKVLADNRARLVSMLSSLSDLGKVGSRVVRESKDATIADLRSLRPILTQLTAAGTALPKSLELLLDYPFPKHSVDGIPGDYTSLYATFNANSFCNFVPIPGLPCSAGSGPLGGGGSTAPQPGTGTSPGLPSVPSLPTVPSLPSAPPAPSPTPSSTLDQLLQGVLS